MASKGQLLKLQKQVYLIYYLSKHVSKKCLANYFFI